MAKKSKADDPLRYSVPSVLDACRILKLLVQQPEGLGVTEIADRLKISRTTAIRIVRTLEYESLLKKNNNRFLSGSGLIQLGLQSISSVNLRNASLPMLKELVAQTGENAHLAELCGDKALLLEVCDSPTALRVAQRPGSFADLHCSATGKNFLAHLVSPTLEELFAGRKLERRTDRTLVTLKDIQTELAKVKAQGYAVDDEEYHPGVRCIAAPIFNAQNAVIAAIGITAATSRLTLDQVPVVSRQIIAAAGRITASMGG